MESKRGKKVGHVKAQVFIKDEHLHPYYLVMDENQYTLMVEGATLPIGYYASLGRALRQVARQQTLNSMSQQSVTLTQFFSRYETLSEKLTNTIKE
jgi:hypothetical protein